MRIGDCVRCGGGIGRRGTGLCHRCRAADREASRRSPCPRCGRVLRLRADTARCVTCSRTCIDCDGIVRRHTDTRCRHCRRRRDAAAAKQTCGRCGRLGLIREHTGWCGTCSRPKPEPQPPRPCGECARLTRRLSNGLCSRCWQRHPDRAVNQAENLASVLDDPPWWIVSFAAYASERMAIGRVSVLVTRLGGLLTDDESPHPQAVLERARTPGRSAGPLARTLEDFFIEHQLAFGLDQPARLAAGRRQRRVDATPSRSELESSCSASASSGPGNERSEPAPAHAPIQPSRATWPTSVTSPDSSSANAPRRTGPPCSQPTSTRS